MPYKHHTARRHHILRARYRILNCPTYEAVLRRPGDLTLGSSRQCSRTGPRLSSPMGNSPPNLVDHGLERKHRSRRSSLVRPYMDRFSSLRRLICPWAWPLFQDRLSTARMVPFLVDADRKAFHHTHATASRFGQQPPTCKCQAIAMTKGAAAVAPSFRGGSARLSQRDLLDRTSRHHLLQARLVARPMLLRPHLFSNPPRQADYGDLTREMEWAAEACSNRLLGDVLVWTVCIVWPNIITSWPVCGRPPA